MMLWLCLGLLLMQQISGHDTRSIEIEDNNPSGKLRIRRQFNWNQRPSRISRQQPFDPDAIIFNNNDDDNFDNRNSVGSSTRRPPPTAGPGNSQTTVAIPGMGTPRTPCEDACQTTPEYNPVCGTDDMTYFTRARLKCAEKCGKRVRLKHLGACARTG